MSRWGPALLIAVGLWAHWSSVSTPFIFDDFRLIVENPHLRQLWPIREAAAGSERPLTALSFALNYAVGRLDVRGYHAVNIVVHLCAALILFGLVRRTLRAPSLLKRFADEADGLAMATALIWLVHPLQTESVTYLSQRAELLAGFWFLATLYSVARAAEAPGAGRRWHIAAVICCGLGMLSKPIMVTAPIVALCYDRACWAGSWREPLHRRGWLYVGLAATWGLLAAVVATSTARHSSSAGFGIASVTPLRYALSQPGVILHYLRLSIWPEPLVLDYQWPIARTAAEIGWPLLILAAIIAAVAWVARRAPAGGFLGAAFFLGLAPTSSVIPLADLAFEHRMYLPLAAVVAGAVIGGWTALGFFVAPTARRRGIAAAALALLVGTLGALTIRRNAAYASEIAVWQDVASKRGHYRALGNLAAALIEAGRAQEALAYCTAVVAQRPGDHEAHNNLGLVLQQLGRLDEAAAQFRKALRLQPDNAVVHNNLGTTLLKQGRIEEAQRELERAIALRPDSLEAHVNLGLVLVAKGRVDEARQQFHLALVLQPDHPEAQRQLERLK